MQLETRCNLIQSIVKRVFYITQHGVRKGRCDTAALKPTNEQASNSSMKPDEKD